MQRDKVIKTLATMSAANRYAATCERNNRDPRIRFVPVPRQDGQWDILRQDRRI